MNVDQNISYETPIQTALSSNNNQSKELAEAVQIYVRKLIRNRTVESENIYNVILSEMERALFSIVLKKANGKQFKAAAWLGIARSTLRMRLKIFRGNF